MFGISRDDAERMGLLLTEIPPESVTTRSQLWVIDQLGNESNRLTGSVDAH